MHIVLHTQIIICFMIVTYLFLVGAISWVAWTRRDDGMRGLALGLCAFTLASILVSLRDVIPTALALSLYYCLMGQAYVFLQYGILKNLHIQIDCKVQEIPVLLLILCNLYLHTDMAQQAMASFVIYILQFGLIAFTILRRKRKEPSCGSNMMVAGMMLAIGLDLWWIWSLASDSGFIHVSSHPDNYQSRLDFMTYVICLLVTNGFILMTKERVETELEENRQTDELTGLLPARRLKDAANETLACLQQLALPVTLILIDIDHFRDINSQYGNACGDRIQRELGNILKQQCTACSRAYRMRDGNFALLASGLNIYQVMESCEEKQKIILDHIFIDNDVISVSCGISVGRVSDCWEEWLVRATKALEIAKARGRNTIHAHGMEFSAENLPSGISRIGQLSWLPTYNTGIAELDAQHQTLFGRTNVMLQLWARTTDKATITNAAADFIDLAATHFQFENKLLDDLNMTGAAEHIARHKRILTRANDMLTRYQKNAITNDALFNFLVFEFAVPHTCEEVAEFAARQKNAA